MNTDHLNGTVADVVPFLLSVEGISTIDEIHAHRESSTPWG